MHSAAVDAYQRVQSHTQALAEAATHLVADLHALHDVARLVIAHATPLSCAFLLEVVNRVVARLVLCRDMCILVYWLRHTGSA
jgi:hypothetical protein